MFRVPGGTSIPGLPARVTVPGLVDVETVGGFPSFGRVPNRLIRSAHSAREPSPYRAYHRLLKAGVSLLQMSRPLGGHGSTAFSRRGRSRLVDSACWAT